MRDADAGILLMRRESVISDDIDADASTPAPASSSWGRALPGRRHRPASDLQKYIYVFFTHARVV